MKRYDELPELTQLWADYGNKCSALRNDRDSKIGAVGAVSQEAAKIIEEWRSELSKAWAEYAEKCSNILTDSWQRVGVGPI